SLADEIHGRLRTAMISFQNVPPVLRAGRPWHISLPPASNPSCRPQSLTLDDGFLGITTLYAPSPRDHKVDIVAISGLGGHAFGSFKGKEGEHMWLRDALPYDIKGEGHNNPPARVIVYGYESNLEQRDSFQSIEDLGTAFRSSLLRLVGAGTIRPIIFIAHSLGGLVVKQVGRLTTAHQICSTTLISLSKSKNEDHQKLLQAVYGIAFFGVPHDGMAIGSLRAIVGDGENRVLLESVSNINSQILTQQRRNFPEALGGEGESEVLCFYETRMSPTAVQVEGKWQMTGPSEVLVTKASATHCQPWGDREEHICAINRTHSEMVKFQLGDQDYLNALDHIWCLVRRALSKSR
ncbi:hypothetical protein GQ53DRAFT_647556, partial [Thozetella sp. PMI_491]